MSNGVTVELGWPHNYLWPNGGREWHRMAVWRVAKTAREEANWATRIAKDRDWKPDPEARFDIHIVAHPHSGGPLPDMQNLISGLKAHFDGIADALGVNDRNFNAPTVEFADRRQKPMVKVIVTQC